MSNFLFFFSFAMFSKSLLTVLGTLPSPALNWPWKVPPCGVEALPQDLDNSKERSCPHFPPPYYDYGGLACFIARLTPLFDTAGSADDVHTSCLLCNLYFVFDIDGRAAPADRQQAVGSVRLRLSPSLIPPQPNPLPLPRLADGGVPPPVSIRFFHRPIQIVIKCAP